MKDLGKRKNIVIFKFGLHNVCCDYGLWTMEIDDWCMAYSLEYTWNDYLKISICCNCTLKI